MVQHSTRMVSFFTSDEMQYAICPPCTERTTGTRSRWSWLCSFSHAWPDGIQTLFKTLHIQSLSSVDFGTNSTHQLSFHSLATLEKKRQPEAMTNKDDKTILLSMIIIRVVFVAYHIWYYGTSGPLNTTKGPGAVLLIKKGGQASSFEGEKRTRSKLTLFFLDSRSNW